MGAVHHPGFRNDMDRQIAELEGKLAKIDKSLEEGWTYEEYRKRNIIIHRIAVAESRRRGEWEKGSMTEFRSVTRMLFAD